jgi:hypothetical protein
MQQPAAAAERALIMYLVSIAGGNRERPQTQASGTLLHANRQDLGIVQAPSLSAHSLTKTAIAKGIHTGNTRSRVPGSMGIRRRKRRCRCC